MARQPMLKVPVNASTAPKDRMDSLLRGLLAVKKADLEAERQEIEGALKEIDELMAKRKAKKP